MGSLQTYDMAQCVADGLVDMPAALRWHLGANHFPPVSLELVPVCLLAITADPGDKITLPDDRIVTAETICGAFHLEAFREIVNNQSGEQP